MRFATCSMVVTAALALAPAVGASSGGWGASRVGAVRAVVYTLAVHFPLMKNPQYLRGRDGIEASCRPSAPKRYDCNWKASNEYATVSGIAAVRWQHARPVVALTVHLCIRRVATLEGAAEVRCAVH